MNLKKIYFLGIGGIGMSAIARYFHSRGVEVFGYDRTPTELTEELLAEGMRIHFDDDVRRIPPGIDLVVLTPAIPPDHREWAYLRERGYLIKKRAEVLGLISRQQKSVAIAGTHGKTTTSCITTHLLRTAGLDCSAFLGGIALDFGSNFVDGKGDWVVLEADEYDRSFLQLSPDIAVILSMDPDHLDIYGDAQSVLDTGYLAFAKKLKPYGKLLVNEKFAHELEGQDLLTFGIEAGDWQAHKVRAEQGYMVFDVVGPDQKITGIRFTQPGRHNVLNATAAIAVAGQLGVSADAIRAAMLSFRGIKRRFEFLVRSEQVTYIDDYAHHPTELEAAISAAREFFPGRTITGVFQPHLFTRTRDFAAGFAKALDLLDQVLLLDIYPARELPIPGVTADTIFNLMKNPKKLRVTKLTLLDKLRGLDLQVLLTLGAGDIDTFREPIRAMLTQTTP
jgi:UDP-N-acetylmuramate--alanine ligase